MMEIRIARLDPRLLQTPDQVAPEPTSVQSGAKKNTPGTGQAQSLMPIKCP